MFYVVSTDENVFIQKQPSTDSEISTLGIFPSLMKAHIAVAQKFPDATQIEFDPEDYFDDEIVATFAI